MRVSPQGVQSSPQAPFLEGGHSSLHKAGGVLMQPLAPSLASRSALQSPLATLAPAR